MARPYNYAKPPYEPSEEKIASEAAEIRRKNDAKKRGGGDADGSPGIRVYAETVLPEVD